MRPITYRPPRVGMPKVTAACGTRGQGEEKVELTVLAPDHTGWTTQESPTLWWHRAGTMRWPIEVTLVIPGEPKPILQERAEGDASWHRIDLKQRGIKLQVGITYQWAVAAIIDPTQRSKDVVANGSLFRAEMPANLATQLQNVSGRDAVLIYAQNGFWYDAVDRLMSEMNRVPADPELMRWAASLSEQVGLKKLDFNTRLVLP